MRRVHPLRALALAALALLTLAAFSAPVHADALADRLQAHAAWLADDAREGRGIGTAGLDSSAAYIEQTFRDIGLAPLFGDSYRQPFAMGWGATAREGCRLVLEDDSLALNAGLRPAGFSGSDSVSAPLVFAGYGISAPEFDYDDYADIDPTGKLVVVFDGEPRRDDPDALFAGDLDTDHAAPRTKAINAKMQGAAGLIIVPAPGRDDILPTLQAAEPYRDIGLPVAWVTRAGIMRLQPRLALDKLARSIDLNEAPRSLELGDDAATFVVRVRRNAVPVSNVGGLIPGGDRVVVLGAHYDHLGYGQSGSRVPGVHEIHNGADDNASGVAVLLELAWLLAKQPPGPTVMVVAFTGEEAGLVGSSHFVKYPPLPLESVDLMVNFDMVGRMQNDKLTAYGVESAEELRELATTAGEGSGLELALTGGGYGASDQTSFYAKDIPVLHLLTSLHADYHRPGDDAHLLNADGMAKVTRYAESLVRAWSRRNSELTFVASGDPSTQSGRRSSIKVSMGTIPDFSQPDSLHGFRIQGAVPGKPAALAGLQAMDIIVAIDDILVDNIYDLTYALGKFEPGEEVDVRYVRDGDEFTTRLTFVASTPRGERGGHGGQGGPPDGDKSSGHPGGATPHVGHGPNPESTPADSTADPHAHPQNTSEHPERGQNR